VISHARHPAPTRELVLITGSEGLIGSRIAKAVQERYRVVSLDVKPGRDRRDSANFIQCDLTEQASVAAALDAVADRFGREIASVIHLAAYYDFSGEPSPLYEELTVEGTRRLLDGLQTLDVHQFVFSSSLLVMKPAVGDELITEQSPTEGTWDYPNSKLAAEAVIREEHGSIPAVILRIAGVYDEDGHSIPLGQQMARVYEKKLESYMFPGNADHGQPFVHLDDLVDCFVRTVERRRQLAHFELFLVAEPDVMSYRELQEQIGEGLHGREWPTIRIPKVVAKAGAWMQEKTAAEDEPTFIKPWMVDLADMHYPVEVGLAERRLGWRPRHRLRDSLDEMLRRLKSDPRRWYETNKLPLPDDVAAHHA
jgi:nucleoside-diphosphate-sugar epimerase